ncbi:class I SAM-dependent methyltransferase [Thermodesulfobacteriota bacterium]
MDIDQKLIDSIKGFLDPQEGRCLYDMACAASRMGPCLEIGSYCGKSTLYLGTACKTHHAILYSIDHHRGSEEQQPGEEYFDPDLYDAACQRVDTFNSFRNTLEAAALEDTVVPMVCRSDVAARQWSTPLSLVFIDGGHTQDAVSTDYRCWSRHILQNGYLLIHDIFEDPAKGGQAPYLVYHEALSSGLYMELPMVNTLGVLKKK